MLDSTYEKWIVPEHLDLTGVNFAGGDGLSLESAYIISKPVHLLKLAEDVNGGISYGGSHFRLSCDIDLGGIVWQPIGYSSGPFDKREFCGMFDGGGHAVSNFHVENQENKSAGLFGYVEYAVIQNLHVKSFTITEGESVGGVVGYGETSTVASCYAEGRITSSSTNTGGLIGLACNCLLMNSASSVAIEASDGNVAGGLCGYVYNGGKIYNCESFGELKAVNMGEAGGFVGSIKDSALENCHSNVAVTASDCGNVGGFGGLIRNCRLDWCTAKGMVNAMNEETNALVGGFVGFTNSVITRCIAVGNVLKRGTMGAVGGFVGDIVRGSIYSSYSSGNVMGEGFVGGFVGSANCSEDVVTEIGNCYCLGSVTANESRSSAGGFIGIVRRLGGNVVISNCYSYGTLSQKVKGFTVRDSAGSIVDCVWRMDDDGVNDGRSDGRGIQSFTTEQFENADSFAGMGWSIYDSESIWCFVDDVIPKRPHLNGLPVHKNRR
ncbi:MAG: hypothetical protein LBQ36_02585 [Synergistaceae bacterium]|jgi:hypothetical protein|nr:hypothetical protein [Synergistaceae bacterium]